MPSSQFQQQHPLIYLITSGETTEQTTPATEDFADLLKLVHAAVVAGIDLVQIREKQLTGRVLFELSKSAAEISHGTATKLLINDRADIAAAAGADGVHLTTSSLPTPAVRQTFGEEFLVGVSTHSLEEANAARENGADFVVYGPIFHTPAKSEYGDPKGIDGLANVAAALAPCLVLALGGVTKDTVEACLNAGARGVAAIGMLQQTDRLAELTKKVHAMTLKTKR
ncbi:MAG TPA: thiamine phosphate synthase [Pyrinomonadaceae bacterium]|nr:thiamine phosphate synthase [Pyrinomonadaceae bacterium]